MKFFFTFLLLSFFFFHTFSKTAEQWKSRSIYQILTDRFARTDGDPSPCLNLTDYCGGTFKGIQNNLDYIEGMGFNAIWISPVVANTERGYHGYWTSNLYEINPYFGTSQDLHDLIQACHERDIWVMVDVVANHMGYVNDFNYTSIVPFSKSEHYNEYVECIWDEPIDQDTKESCWLAGLPDLNFTNPFVRETLLSWISDFVKTYDFDGLRIDTVQHVPKTFWVDFHKAAGVYTLGEVLNFKLCYLAGYQGAIDSLLNYALYESLRKAFAEDGSMNELGSYDAEAYSTWPDISVIANFVNNHDNPRFLNSSDNVKGFKAMLAFTVTSIGIPAVYYGDEQAFSGGIDPANRETLWTNFSTESEIYQYLRVLNKFRTENELYKLKQIQRYSDRQVYIFSRGEHLFVFTNSLEHQFRIVTSHPYADGTVICNIFSQDDCTEISEGKLILNLYDGEVKIFTPKNVNAIALKEDIRSDRDDLWHFFRV